MKNVDKLLCKAMTLLERIADVFFPDNDDGFLQCLGVDPERYEHVHPDGSIGYDFLKALADTAGGDWEDYDDDIPATVFTEEAQEYENHAQTVDSSKEPWKCPWWNSLARTEKREILLELGIPEEKTDSYIEYVKEQPKQKKSKSLFGWG